MFYDELNEEAQIWRDILDNLEAYGNPAGPCLWELPPHEKGI